MRKFILTLLALLCCDPAMAAQGPEPLDLSTFSLLSVLHEGRVKPLDTYARLTLRSLSGRETINGKDAVTWLAQSMFAPEAAAKIPVFRISNPELKARLTLDHDKRYFTLLDLAPAFAKAEPEIKSLQQSPPEKLAAEQTEFLDLFEKVIDYAAILQQKDMPESWRGMEKAYRDHDAAAWKSAVATAHKTPSFRLQLEKFYNLLKPFRLAMGFYALGLVIIIAEIKNRRRRALFPFICLGLGMASHIFGIGTRIFLLQRPPVGTLYESLLFVSLLCAAAGSILSLRGKNFTLASPGMLAAASLLFIAPLLPHQGDGLEMLSAVLNTNFWLATHVLCITAGYAACIITACLAHGYFLLRPKNAALQTAIYRASLIALLLTGIGTILGGIWADQSWGRFWGWDPKENGALLIVLWLIWMQHGKLSGKLGPSAFIAAAAFLNVIVALAWFGVNLLGVGLHSYGFTSGLSLGLGLFCAAETFFIAALWRLHAKRPGPAGVRR